MICKECESSHIWTTKAGEEIPFAKLADSHLLNIIKFVSRNVEASRSEALDTASNAMDMLHGEMALMSVERDINFLIDADIYELNPRLICLEKEAEKRKLKF